MHSDNKKPYFLTVEGIEGVGKSTAVQWMAEWFEQKKIPVCLTREPGGTFVGEAVRDILLHHKQKPLDHMAELLLLFAQRAQHLAEVIRPALARGEWVLCDRFTDATYAYQGYGRGFPEDIIAWLETQVQTNLKPDVTILLDAPIAVALERIKTQRALDRFESESTLFFEKVQQGYWARMKMAPERFRLINANQSLVNVQADLNNILQSLC